VGRKHRGDGALAETANDFAPLRDVPGETSWFLYGSEGFKQKQWCKSLSSPSRRRGPSPNEDRRSERVRSENPRPLPMRR